MLTTEQQEKMFGETMAEMIEAYQQCGNSLTDPLDLTMYSMAILSDAQETMARGNAEQARQWINKAKYFITESRSLIRKNERKGA